MSKSWVRPAWIATFTAAAAAACSGSGAAALRPTPSLVSSDAAPDGSTLKVTAPTLLSPVGGVLVTDLDPDMVFGHSSPLYVSEAPGLQYEIQVVNEDDEIDYSTILAPSTAAMTSHEIQGELRETEPYTWRVRARLGAHVGPWSAAGSFLTFASPSALPPGPYPGDGPGVVALVAQTWPEYLVATATFGERAAQMHFIRDRIIEIGRCGGLDLALNTKSNGIISDDAITWKFGPTDGDVEVVDIALDWDNNDNDLRIHWAITEGPAGYTPLPNPQRCR